MGVPTSEIGYTPAMPRREDREVHKRTCGGIEKKIYIHNLGYVEVLSENSIHDARTHVYKMHSSTYGFRL